MKVFISYRREDSAGHAGRLHDSLQSHFGADNVFMDLSDIDSGTNFVEVIQAAIRSSDVVLALIGKQWLTCSSAGKRRLDLPNDFVRTEIALLKEAQRTQAADLGELKVTVTTALQQIQNNLQALSAEFGNSRRANWSEYRGWLFGGITGALIGMGIPEYEAKRYEGKVKVGHILLSVRAQSWADAERAKEIFEATGAQDIATSPGRSASNPKDRASEPDYEGPGGNLPLHPRVAYLFGRRHTQAE